MLFLVTGIPGHGKTLFMIDQVRKISQKDNRPVYYYGINDLRLPWNELTHDDVMRWYEVLPPNSILCVDEGQMIFRPTAATREPPPHVAKLETHRHLGIDIWLTTQDPSFVHAHWRKLAGRHYHLLRKFGMQVSTVYEWNEVRDDPQKGRGMASTFTYDYNKEIYGLYKSAEAHTQKIRIPKRLIFAAILPILMIGWLYYGVTTWYEKSVLGTRAEAQLEKKKEKAAATPAAPANSSGPSFSPGQGGSQQYQPPQDPRESWLRARTPVLPGLPHTAPVYASLTSPKRVPAPMACMLQGSRCWCYTDGGTRLPQVPDLTCRQIVEHGFYADWQTSPPVGPAPVQSSQVIAQRPEGAAPAAP